MQKSQAIRPMVAVGIAAIAVETVGIVYFQPLTTLSIGIGEFYSSGRILPTTIVAMSIAIVFSIALVMLMLRQRASDGLSTGATELLWSTRWAICNRVLFMLGLILLVFTLAQLIQSFSFFALEDDYGHFPVGPQWLTRANRLLVIPICLLAACSEVARRVTYRAANRSGLRSDFSS